LTLRNASKKPAGTGKSSAKIRSPILPYGFAWLEGKLVMDPHEYKVVLKIMNLWHFGKSLTAIADFLNGQKIPTRMGKQWFHSAVGAIVKRQSKENQ